MNIFKRLVLAYRYAYTPITEMAELLELTVKAGRRVTHDLQHCAADCADKDQRVFWHERAYVWINVFYPGRDGKNYRSRLLHDILELETEVDRLKELCLANSIDPSNPDGVPF